jgi:hypothetical protein
MKKQLQISIMFALLLQGVLLAGQLQAATTFLGYDGNGNATEAFNADIRGGVFEAAECFVADKIYVRLDNSGTATIYAAIYSANASTDLPESLLGQTAGQAAVSGWNSLDLLGKVNIVGGQHYFICFDVSSAATVRYLGFVDGVRWSTPGDGSAFPDSFGSAAPGPTNLLCIYMEGTVCTPTRTPTTGPTKTRSPTPTISKTTTETPFVTETPTFTASPTISPTATVTPTISGTATFTPTVTQTITRTTEPTVIMTAISTYAIPANSVVAGPSPASGDTIWFYYQAANNAEVEIEIYSILGQKGKVIKASHMLAGSYRTAWDIRDVATGVYLYRVRIKSPSGSKDFGLRKIAVVD